MKCESGGGADDLAFGSSEEEPEQSSAEADRPGGPGVLIVEDDPAIGYLLADALRFAGLRTSIVTDGRDAERRARTIRAVAVLLDLMLPFESGHAVAERLQRHPLFKLVPIVVLSARSGPVDRLESLRRGVVVHLAKPFDIEEVVLTVRNLVDLRSSVFDTRTWLPGASTFRDIAASWMEGTADWAVLLLYPGSSGGGDAGISKLADLALEVADELRDGDAIVGHFDPGRLAILTRATFLDGYGRSLIRRLAGLGRQRPTADVAAARTARRQLRTTPTPVACVGAVTQSAVHDGFGIVDLETADRELAAAIAQQPAPTMVLFHPQTLADWSPRLRQFARFWGNA